MARAGVGECARCVPLLGTTQGLTVSRGPPGPIGDAPPHTLAGERLRVRRAWRVFQAGGAGSTPVTRSSVPARQTLILSEVASRPESLIVSICSVAVRAVVGSTRGTGRRPGTPSAVPDRFIMCGRAHQVRRHRPAADLGHSLPGLRGSRHVSGSSKSRLGVRASNCYRPVTTRRW
jgi:hypothetical protein